jgi:hypothetical protein
LILTDEGSAVLEFGAPEPRETATTMGDKLRFHTDDQCEQDPGWAPITPPSFYYDRRG